MNYNYYFFFTVAENNTIFIIKITSKICLSYIKLIKTQAISSSPFYHISNKRSSP